MKDPSCYFCPVEGTLDVIGGKWKPLIIWYLRKRILRFSVIQRAIPGITDVTLTKHLRELEEDGIIRRKVYKQVPPKVEYSLTPLGKTLIPLLDTLCEWGIEHMHIPMIDDEEVPLRRIKMNED
ncbi:winged helix-turn-helix transcriptional regulator [Methanospirillum lacunae]|uniref:Transcriptional regulator n=1 Tax=Methanospirillum lacunae TaxID=668570 RepID=A0A2V2MU65_9EURY|nr:helix-turn-helix domain-containing protein [Methanospirillum lacunae]PWR70939.1 transcriptional regulator [Methanospirillum lacunae]